ncbi:MAG: hypothetical protein EA397_06565 [Deltaproteobacteria bacterium]|nr:MAG: hypothetical protein EA397_06565 [Deltaproteobacteria bacterium]
MLGGPAWAGRGEQANIADGLEVDIGRLVAQADEIERSVAPGRGFMSPSTANQRYKDCVYYYLIGDYRRAAEGFYALVATSALTESGLHSDAEWYLAESLQKLGNLETAAANYRAIVKNSAQPFREDAVRALLEIYVDLGRDDAFLELFQAEIASGKTQRTDLVNYAVGKAFFRKGRLAEATDNLERIGPQSPYYPRVRYILGAAEVRRGELRSAAEIFDSIIDLQVETSDDRKVLDLSLLALGRIHMELGEYSAATRYYGAIGLDSEYLDDKLYEEIWTFIKQNEEIRKIRTTKADGFDATELSSLQLRERDLVKQALRGLDIFLLRFTDHRYTAQLRLLRGHLHIQAVEYDRALRAYEGVIQDYAPVLERLEAFTETDGKPQTFFRQLTIQGDLADVTQEIPGYATAMVLADRDFVRALGVYQDLENQRQTLTTSQQLIAELGEALREAEGLGGFNNLRYDAKFTRSTAVQRHFELVELEDRVLTTTLTGDQRRQVDGLGADRERRKKAALMAIADGDTRAARAEIQAVREARASFRAELRSASDQDLLQRLDRLHGALFEVDDRMAQIDDRLRPIEREELGRVIERFESEIQKVGAQEQDLEQTLADAEAVSVALTRSGFGRLEDFFAQSILRADVGIVDVYWARKIDISEERNRLVEERNGLRRRVLDRFELIEQKLRR